MASPGPSLFLSLMSAFLHIASFSDFIRWLPTYSGLHNPRLKTSIIEENTLFFSYSQQKFLRLHIMESVHVLIPEPFGMKLVSYIVGVGM